MTSSPSTPQPSKYAVGTGFTREEAERVVRAIAQKNGWRIVHWDDPVMTDHGWYHISVRAKCE